MKCNFLLLLITVFSFTRCEDKATGQDLKNKIIQNYKNKKNQIQIKDDTVIIPNINLTILLSKDAIQKLQENKESVIASLLLYGSVDDEDTIPEEIRNEVGPDGLKLGLFEMEEKNVTDVINFNFEKITISKKLYDNLSNKDISVNINVFSGRKYFKDNILNMEAYDSKLDKVILNGNKVKLNGHLIPETTEMK
ncbi:hypothetical protein [Elizabethkingia ursingii]|jgi:hypothetical protein|uniref:Uncharacterized protein n=1 Tax=Elizabethkingia ursingii TaxID=1756150 RepID=A0AAC9QIN2_9FLAO|nr:hypothetical protein [Elizabethkingia ursingii]AQX09699.1 hypothetical protein BBD34_14090 [Elizabethkingia ursingii]MCT3905013.1 hypothetical protein [Elizabethkingia anophelis]OPB75431.1 hypothetical protein BAY32_07840 [Elizabethkingia ursingii]